MLPLLPLLLLLVLLLLVLVVLPLLLLLLLVLKPPAAVPGAGDDFGATAGATSWCCYLLLRLKSE
ncbi:MAG: hypothetical protein GY772_06595 [bacterium]|nr:hypothetical protein [bacterium]